MLTQQEERCRGAAEVTTTAPQFTHALACFLPPHHQVKVNSKPNLRTKYGLSIGRQQLVSSIQFHFISFIVGYLNQKKKLHRG
jgi:hypothetical protein